MPRWAFGTAAVASLLLCCATLAFWRLSSTGEVECAASRADGPTYMAAKPDRPGGGLVFQYIAAWTHRPFAFATAAPSRDELNHCHDVGTRQLNIDSNVTRLWSPSASLVVYSGVMNQLSLLWCGGGNVGWVQTDYAVGPSRTYCVYVDCWLATAMSAVLPVLFAASVAARVVRRRRRRRAGRCAACGYDLRGSGARCPECGVVSSVRGRPSAVLPPGLPN